eukprot:4862194-Pyramimonas_sp.AAC.1
MQRYIQFAGEARSWWEGKLRPDDPKSKRPLCRAAHDLGLVDAEERVVCEIVETRRMNGQKRDYNKRGDRVLANGRRPMKAREERAQEKMTSEKPAASTVSRNMRRPRRRRMGWDRDKAD